MEDAIASEAWEDHSEQLKTVIFGHSVLQVFQDSAEVSQSSSDLEKIDAFVSKHPWNDTQKGFGSETCERLVKTLVPSGKTSLPEFKLALLDRVRKYIIHGIDVLKTAAGPSSATKRARSESVEVESETTKRRKLDETVKSTAQPSKPVESTVSKPNSEAAGGVDTRKATAKEEDTGGADAAESEIVKSDEGKELAKGIPSESPAVDAADVPTIVTEEPAESKAETERKDENVANIEPLTDAGTDSSKPAETQQQQLIEPERPSRRRSRTRRSARSTPEPTTEPAQSSSSATVSPIAEGKEKNAAPSVDETKEEEVSESVVSKEEPEESKKETEVEAKVEKDENEEPDDEEAAGEDEIDDEEKEESHVESESESANESESGEENGSEVDEEAQSDENRAELESAAAASPSNVKEEEPSRPGKRKLSVTFDEEKPLEKLVTSLLRNRLFSPFEEATKQASSPMVRSPTSLNNILQQIRDNELESVDDVEVELLKMVANSVVIGETDQKRSTAIIAVIDAALAQLKEDESPTTPAGSAQSQQPSKRRRR